MGELGRTPKKKLTTSIPLPPVPVEKEDWRAIQVLEEIERNLVNLVDSKEEHEYRVRKDGSYRFIPMMTSAVAKELTTVKTRVREENKKGWFPEELWTFIDFGCGFGTKPALASKFGFRPKGFELDKNYIDIGQKLFKRVEFVEKSILELTKEDIGTSPIIAYYYCPICSEAPQKQFEELLEDLLPVGSYLMPFLKKSEKFMRDGHFKQLSPELYLKVS